MSEVKILIYTNPHELERKICYWMERDYSLHGPVTMGVNSTGNPIYVGTMVKNPVKEVEK